MPDRLRIQGVWPDPVIITRGWFRASARPWNQDVPDAMVRLERGGADFLAEVTDWLIDRTGSAVLSPAVYPHSTRIWRKCGFEDAFELQIMERSVVNGPEATAHVTETDNPDWAQIVDLDDRAFEGFWKMSVEGLEEARQATKRSVVLTIGDTPLSGFAIVGSQWNVGYLQRIAVDPAHTGEHIGSSMVRRAIDWARRSGAQTIVLNVRHDNDRARSLYTREGFVDTGTALRILRSEP